MEITLCIMKKVTLFLGMAGLMAATSGYAQAGAPSATTVTNNNFGTRLSTNYGRNFGVGQPNNSLGQTPGIAIRPTTPALQPGTPALQPRSTVINPAGGTPGVPPSPVIPSGTGTSSVPGAALGNQDATAIGQQGSTAIGQPSTAIGQPGSTAIGQPSTAIGQSGNTAVGQENSVGQQTPSQPNAIIVNADGSITRLPAAGGSGIGLGGTNFGFGTNGALIPTNRFTRP